LASSDVAECMADMAESAKAVREILQAIGAVPQMFGDQTWQGPSADQWAAHWNARRGRLTTLLNAILDEQPHIIARLQEAASRNVAT
jgi:hypothetical protein